MNCSILAATHAGVDDALGDQARGVKLADRRVMLNRGVHQRLGEARLVGLVVAEAAVAPHVDDDVALEPLAELGRDLGREGHRFGIVAVDVEDRCLDDLGDVGRIRRRPRELRAGGEADLVVDDVVDRPAGVVPGQAREAEAFGDDALPRERGVAVHQDRENLAVLVVAAHRLDRADLAEDDRVDRLEVRRVRRQRQMDGVAVELAVGRGAEVVLDVARSADVVGVGRAAAEFVEDHPERLLHDVAEHVQPPAVGHAENDFLDAVLAADLDDRLHRRDHRLAAVETEALGPDILLAEEALELLGLDQLVEDRLLAELGELDFLVAALDPLLDEAALLDVVDVHVFDADVAAIVRAQDRHQLADRAGRHAQRATEVDRPVEVGLLEAVIFGRQVGGQVALGQAERVEVGGEMPADAVGADQHHRADAVVRRGLGRRRVGVVRDHRGGSRLDPRLGRFRRQVDAGGVEGEGQIVGGQRGPVGPRPRRSGQVAGRGNSALIIHRSRPWIAPGAS